jgi:hypothetical protein
MPSTPQSLDELKNYLAEQCYQSSVYNIGPFWSSCADTWCMEHTRSGFEIFYVERGQRRKSDSIHESEAGACAAFLAKLNEDRWSQAHCVGFFSSEVAASEMGAKLIARGVPFKRNDIPAYRFSNDQRFRIFVFGTDKKIVDSMVASGNFPPLAYE